jgi:predicted cupin superfamily sugar epimerase
MDARTRARDIIAQLGLTPHPERGFYVESYRAGTSVTAASHPAARAASTAIYFLVTADQPTTYLHRLRSDELFHLYEGGPLDILLLHDDGRAESARLGLDLAAGERPQLAIAAGTWFGVELAAHAAHCLVGCTVAPGFDFADFELAEGSALLARHPMHCAQIARMSRPRSEDHR